MANLSKNRGLALSKSKGFTLIESLIVLAILLILIFAAIAIFKPQGQLQKARDARRKADLSLLKNKLDDYYNDKGRYPANLSLCGQSFTPYLNQVPCDPKGGDYTYLANDSGQWYKIYAKLEYEKDAVIASIGCQSGCGPSAAYNYGVSSPNVSVGETMAGLTPTPTPSGRCLGWTPPGCTNPQAYCPPSGVATQCCPGLLYCSGGEYWCCP